jgi:ribonuclease PH
MRRDGRAPDELRPVQLTLDYVDYPEGSVLLTLGGTRVLCNVSLEDRLPRWLAGQNSGGQGWLTAEYALLPRSTHTRTPREIKGLRGRTQEIRRLIGRSLRAAVNLEMLGERQVTVDCDVLQADGGTRTAAITGGYVAVALALQRQISRGVLGPEVLLAPVAATSVGVVDGVPLLDLQYAEDSAASVDGNVVMTATGEIIEAQFTAEGAPFSRAVLDELMSLAQKGIQELLGIQQEALQRSDGARE